MVFVVVRVCTIQCFFLFRLFQRMPKKPKNKTNAKAAASRHPYHHYQAEGVDWKVLFVELDRELPRHGITI